jgi:hypothetical protein
MNSQRRIGQLNHEDRKDREEINVCLWIGRIGCLMFSRSSRRAPLKVVSSASDKMQYVNFRAFAPPKQHCTSELGSRIRFFDAPIPDCRNRLVVTKSAPPSAGRALCMRSEIATYCSPGLPLNSTRSSYVSSSAMLLLSRHDCSIWTPTASGSLPPARRRHQMQPDTRSKAPMLRQPLLPLDL